MRIIFAVSLLLAAVAAWSPAAVRAPRCAARRASLPRPLMQMEVRAAAAAQTRHWPATRRIAGSPDFCALRCATQELEFIIHPDGRVEERVRGVKGVNCQSLTEEINKALGEVYESKPTQEMFEQEIEVSVEAEATVSESWTGSSTVRTQ